MIMRRHRRSGGLALLVCSLIFLLLMANSALVRARDVDLLLINRTGVDIRELYVSRQGTQEWEADRLRGQTLRNGGGLQTRLARWESDRWDIKIVDGEGTSLEWTGLNLARASQVTLYLRDGRVYADLE